MHGKCVFGFTHGRDVFPDDDGGHGPVCFGERGRSSTERAARGLKLKRAQLSGRSEPQPLECQPFQATARDRRKSVQLGKLTLTAKLTKSCCSTSALSVSLSMRSTLSRFDVSCDFVLTLLRILTRLRRGAVRSRSCAILLLPSRTEDWSR
jgi:hypothetical protein